MRNIEIKPGVNTETTRIFVDGIRLETFFDNAQCALFSRSKFKLPPITGKNLVDAMRKKLSNDVVNLTKQEVEFIVDEFKKVLGL
jgi:hypothetical protein